MEVVSTAQESSPTKQKQSHWLVLFICFLATLSTAVCMNEISPILPGLMVEFGFSASQMGVLVSAFSVAGLILAIPSGLIVTKIGTYKTGLIALTASVTGMAIMLGSSEYSMLLAGRIIGGASLSLLAVICPAVVLEVFAGKKHKGLAMGIFNTYMGSSLVLSYSVIPRFYEATSWKMVVLASMLFCVLALALWLITMKQVDAKEKQAGRPLSIGTAMKRALQNKYLWILAITFALVLFAFQGQFSFFTLYLTKMRGLTAITAADYSLVYSIVSMAMPTLVGLLCDKIKSYKIPMFLIFAGHCVMYFILPAVAGQYMLLTVVAWSVFAGGTSTGFFAAMPNVVGDRRLYAMGISVIGLCEKAGIFAGVTLYGYMVEHTGWQYVFYLSAILMALACIFVVGNKKIKYGENEV